MVKRVAINKFFALLGLLNFITLCLFVPCVNTQLANSPWPMLGHDERHTGQSSYTGRQNSDVKWIYPVGARSGARPVISSDGSIYIGSSDNKLYALNPNGTLKWSYLTGDDIESTPAIDTEGTVYVGSNDNKFYALNPNGTLKWSYLTGGNVSSSPAIAADGAIYVGSEDNNLYVFDKNGNLKWRYSRAPSSDGSGVAIGQNSNIYFVYNQYLFAILPSAPPPGEPYRYIWSYLINSYWPPTPAVANDGTIYAGSSDSNLYAINANGTLRWRYTAGGSLGNSTPAIASDGTIYIGSDDTYIYAINPGGSLKWKYKTGGRIYSSASIGSDGTIYIGSNDRYVYALNPNGTLKWSYNTGSSVQSSSAIAQDGSVYICASNYKLFAFGEAGIKTISGTVRYQNRIFNETGTGNPNATEFKPVRFAKIEIVRDPDQAVLGTGATNDDGTYNIEIRTFINDKVRLKCYSQQDTADYKIEVKNSETGPVYFSQSEVKTVDADNLTLNLDITEAGNEGGAFNIFDCLVDGARKVKALSGAAPSSLLTVFWQRGIAQGTGYENNKIYLSGSSNDPDEYDDAVILHEYGHFIMDKFSYSRSPGGNHEKTDTNQDIRLSWSEGWATFFSSLCRNNFLYLDIIKDSQTAQYIAIITNIDTLDDSQWNSLANFARGQDTEVAVSAILWDIFDSPLGDDDPLGSGAQYIWNVFDGYIGVNTDCVLEDFYNGWFSQNGSNFYRPEINNIFSARSVFYSSPSFTRGEIFTKADGRTVPNGAGESLSSILSISDNLSIRYINVFVDIAYYSNKSDLIVKLISPAGREIVLHNRSGQSQDIFAWYQPPYETIPDEGLVSLDKFKGDTAQGNWTLKVEDLVDRPAEPPPAPDDIATLNRWEVEVRPDSPPQIGTIAPSGGSSLSDNPVTFTTTYIDPDNWQDIQSVYFLINTSTNGANCFFGYYNQDENKLYLRNDVDTDWIGGFAPGSNNIIENSYAKLDCA